MTSPSIAATEPTEPTEPWQAGFAGPGLSDLAAGAMVLASEQGQAGTGVLVTYSEGAFTRRFWSDGPPIPLIIEILPPEELKALGDQLDAQLEGAGSGLDDIPLRDFAEAIRLHLSSQASSRFAAAAFGSIATVNPGEFLGQVSWPGDVVGTIAASAGAISAQTHLAHLGTGDPAPLRKADIRSLVLALQASTVNAQWEQVLSFAEQAL
jgi:hypothetical protein